MYSMTMALQKYLSSVDVLDQKIIVMKAHVNSLREKIAALRERSDEFAKCKGNCRKCFGVLQSKKETMCEADVFIDGDELD